jgi:adenosine kinase
MSRARNPGSALVCGSIAYDTIMVFDDRFRHHILPEQLHILNVSFLVPRMRRDFGGCAGNIVYNLGLLGDRGYPMATVGRDFGLYREWLQRSGVSVDYVRTIEAQHTAQAFITTDLDGNQITAFHPGAMLESHLIDIPRDVGISLGIVAPDGREGMVEHARQFAAAGIPFMFDPGQGLPMFGVAELTRFVEQAAWVVVNDYEWRLLQQKTGWTTADVTERVEALIVTRGAAGSTIYTDTEEIAIPCAKVGPLASGGSLDPTGCGDAYRAGLVHGLLHSLDWKTTGRIAAVMGAIKIESLGTQNHTFSAAEFQERYTASFGSPATALELGSV